MKTSKRKRPQHPTQSAEIVNPYEKIGKYFTSRSPIGEQDIMKIIFIVYCAKKDIRLNFVDNILVSDAEICDNLYLRLYNAATGGRQDHKFQPYVVNMYEAFVEANTRVRIHKEYLGILSHIVQRNAGFRDNILFPPLPLLTTISHILDENDCKSVYLFNDNLGALSWFLSEDVSVYAHNEVEYLNLIRDVLYDALGSKGKIRNHDGKTPYDAIVSFSGVDYFYAQGIDKYITACISKSNLQKQVVSFILDNCTADIMVFLLHHRLGNDSDYTSLRKRFCDEGILDAVVTLSDDTFDDIKVCTSLVVLNRKKTDDKVTFIYSDDLLFASEESDYDIFKDARPRNRTQVTYREMAEVEWSLNARLYLSPAPKCREGQELIRLKDLIIRRAQYDSYAKDSQVLSMCSCSDSIIEAMGELEYIKGRSRRDTYCKVSQPAVIFHIDEDSSINAAVYDSSEPCFIDDSVYTLIPDTSKVLPEYLAYVILHDHSFRKYLWDLMEYPKAFQNILPEYILNREIAIYTDIEKQRQIVDALRKGKEGSRQYNVLIASADSEIIGEERLSLLSRRNIRVVDTAASAMELEQKLKVFTQGSVSASDKLDAVIVDASIPSGSPKSTSQYDGFIAVSSYIQRQYEIPFYAMSDVPRDNMTQVPYFCWEYFTSETNKRFFSKEINQFTLLLNSLIDELETIKSDDSVLRNKYPEFYTAAEWLDSQRAGMNFAAEITKELKADINCSQEDMDKTVNNIRILTQNIFEWIQEVNLAPASLDPGAVAIMLRDKTYKDYMYPNQNIMDESLASMIATLYKIGNEGSHKFFFCDLYRRTAILSLMTLVQWAYDNKHLFDKQHEGFYISSSIIEVQEFEDVVQCDTSRGEPYFYTRNVHLGIGKISNIKAGDKVRVSGYSLEKKNRREDLGVIYFSDFKNWSKIN